MKKGSAFLFLFLCCGSLFSQPLLTPEEALKIALKNNYDILVARNDLGIDKANNTAGNAGLLPSLSVNGSDNYAFAGTVNQKLLTGASNTFGNGNSNALALGVDLDWTLFDGGKMFVTRTKLKEIEAAGEYRFQDKVTSAVYDVVTSYYNVVNQKQLLRSYQEVINLNQERVKILETGFISGAKPKTDFLQAKIDLNVVREQVIVQESVIISAKRSLNQLLSRNPEEPFEVVDTIIQSYIPDKESMLKNIYAKNPSLLTIQKEVDIANLTVREQRSLFFPRLNLNAGYSFLQSDNNTSSIRMNRSFGPQVGGILSFPIYQAGNTRRLINISKLQLNSSNIALESRKTEVSRQLQDALTAFYIQKDLLNIEIENRLLARENLFISMERLRLGQSTSLELRQAQQSYSESSTRLLNLEYNLKVAETRLKQLMAEL